MIRAPFLIHYSAVALSDRLVFTLPAHRNWFVITAFTAWELACLGIDVSLLGSALGRGSAEDASVIERLAFQAFALVLCLLFTYGGAIALLCLLWQLTGRDVIEVSAAGNRLARVMLGHTEEKMYQAGRITELRVAPVPVVPGGRGRPMKLYCSVGTVAFSYAGEPVWFGTNNLAESARVVKSIQLHDARYRS